ncbi:Auxin-responsive protein IAA27 [Bienertia sinuspersici]
MDGAPYLRKVDLQTYKIYMELSALEKMFNCFITGQYGSKGHGTQDVLGESQSTDLQDAEFVLHLMQVSSLLALTILEDKTFF